MKAQPINLRLREHQESDPELGAFFKALHTFTDRTIEMFFDDTPHLPHPVIGFERVRTSCRGEFMPKDGRALQDCIIIDPFKSDNGEEAAEVLAHELVHVWQHHIKRLPDRNYHNAEFHNRLGLMGILSSGKAGHHNGYVEGEVWQGWLEENADLQLAKFILPGGEEPRRRLLKWQCAVCGFSFHSRRQNVNAICMMEDCGEPFEEVDE